MERASPSSPRLHSFIALKPALPAAAVTSSRPHGGRVLSPTKPTRHLSPRKFYAQQQQQRQAVLRNMLPLSPIQQRESERTVSIEPVPWNPAWLPFPIDDIPVVTPQSLGSGMHLSLGSASLDAWLASFDRDVLAFESLEKFVEVKLPEALAFIAKMEQQIADMEARERLEAAAEATQQPLGGSRHRRGPKKLRTTSAMTRFPVRFRVAVFASLVERAVVAMTQSAALAHLKPWLLQARQELFRAVFVDYGPYEKPRKKRPATQEGDGDAGGSSVSTDGSEDEDDDDESDQDEPVTPEPPRSPTASMAMRFGPDAPRPLSFFLSRVPFILKLEDETHRRATRFQRHQVVLRRIVQSLYRSLGSVFHAWKMYTRQRHEERLNDKGAALTAMVVLQRGLVRSVFVEWSKCTLQTKLAKAHAREAHAKRVHDERVNDLYKELFVLREENARLARELEHARHGVAFAVEEEQEDSAPETETTHHEVLVP